MTISVEYLKNPPRIEISQDETDANTSIVGRVGIIIDTVEKADGVCKILEHLQTKFIEELR